MKIRIRHVVILLIIALVSVASFFLYTETYGYPCKHAQIKKQAISYMKDKYNMDVKVEKSIYNFKFEYYIAVVSNVNDESTNLVDVVKQKYYDENGQLVGERLEDNYGKVYWEPALKNELYKKYPEFFIFPDIDQFHIDIAYHTIPLDGVSSIKDDNGLLIPLKPEDNFTLEIDLHSKDFSDEFLKELLLVIKDLAETELRAELFITGKSEERINESNFERTKLIKLPYEKFQNINSLEDLKSEISEF